MTESAATMSLYDLLRTTGHFIAIPADADRAGTGIYGIGIRPSFAIAEAFKATRVDAEQFIAVPATKRLYQRIEAEGFNNLTPAFRYGLVEGVADILDGPRTFHVFDHWEASDFVNWYGTAQSETAWGAVHTVVSEHGFIPGSRTSYIAVESDKEFADLFRDQGDGCTFRLVTDHAQGLIHRVVCDGSDFDLGDDDDADGALVPVEAEAPPLP